MNNTSKMILVPFEKYNKLLQLSFQKPKSQEETPEKKVLSPIDEKAEDYLVGNENENENTTTTAHKDETVREIYKSRLLNELDEGQRDRALNLLAKVDNTVWSRDGRLKVPFDSLTLKDAIYDMLGEKCAVNKKCRKLIKQFIFTDTSIEPSMIHNELYAQTKRRKLNYNGASNPKIISWINC